MKILLALAIAVSLVGTSCRTLENGAAKDPRKCELDPNCARKPGKSNDCATQCSDDIACMDRCKQVTNPMDR